MSAFSGTGFTTKEAESVINHPQRRKIIRWLMMGGNAGIVTVIVAATSSMVTSRGYQLPINVVILLIGILLIYKLAKFRGFTRKWEGFIERKLIKSAVFEDASTEDLLHFLEGYGVLKKMVKEDSTLIGKTLLDSNLSERGVLVLGIERKKNWIPTPKASEMIRDGDHLVVYGPLSVLKSRLDIHGSTP